jgi:hypothetical protein
MIALFYKFLNRVKNENRNCHVLMMSNDWDFHLVSNKLKRYSKVKTHLITSRVIENSFFNGLADTVSFYERIKNAKIPKLQVPPEAEPLQRQKRIYDEVDRGVLDFDDHDGESCTKKSKSG